MKLRTLLATACIAAAILIGCKGASGGDTADFKFNVPKGTKFNYSIAMDMNMNQSMMGQTVKVTSKITMAYLFEVINDSAGWKTLSTTISRFGMMMNANGMNIDIDTDKPSADSTNPMAKVGKIFEALKGGQFAFTMNEKGEVGQVTGMEEMTNKILAGMAPNDTLVASETLKKAFNEENFKQNLQQSFAMYPGKPVKVGESWNKTMTINNNGMVMKMNATYTLASIEGSTIKVNVDSKITADSAAITPGMQMDITGNMKGPLTFDLPTGMPLKGDESMILNMKMKMQGQEIPMKMDMKIAIEGKKL